MGAILKFGELLGGSDSFTGPSSFIILCWNLKSSGGKQKMRHFGLFNVFTGL